MLKVNNNLIASLLPLPKNVIGFHLTDVDDSEAIIKIKKLESICISFNILPNGFVQDPDVSPSRWTTIKSIVYTSIITVYLVHLALLSVFDLPDEWLLILGDFFHRHPKRRFFWQTWLIASVVSEVLRQYWILLMKNGKLSTLKLYHFIYSNGFKSEVVLMDQFHCRKFRFVAINLANMWIWIVSCIIISFAPILIFIIQSAPHLPRTYTQLTYTSFWLLINYLGIVSTLNNMILPGAVVTIHLSYFYFKTNYVAKTVQDLASKRGKLNKVAYYLAYKSTVRQIIKYQNEIEQVNMQFRNWLIFLYFGISFTADFALYTAIFVHIDKFMDIFILSVAVIGVAAIGACSYTNGVILTKMSSYAANLRKVTKYLQLSPKAFIKGTDLRDRLLRTDAAFTIGELLNMTTHVFVIYLIENICLVMMFKCNFM